MPSDAALGVSVGVGVVRVLDALRKQRNLSDYDGESITDQALVECIEQALRLQELAVRRFGGQG